MATPYRGYTEVPGGMTPDVPYRLNLALREIDADVQDLELATAETEQELSGRLAVVEAAAGFGAGMKLQDDAVNSLLLGDTKAAATVRKQIETRGPAATVADLAVMASPTREAFDAYTLSHLADHFHGPLKDWGQALRDRKTKPAIWVNLGSSTANGGTTTFAGQAWAQRVATYITGRSTLDNAALPRLEGIKSRPANGVHAYTGAIGGTQSSNYVNADHIAAIKVLQPALVTHMVGSNDYGSRVAVATYKTRLRNWLDQVIAAAPGAAHMLIHQQPRNDIGNPVAPWHAYGDAMREVADLYPNVAFLDASAYFPAEGAMPGHIMTEAVHMNTAGHKVLADVVAAAMGTPIYYATDQYDVALGGSGTVPSDTWAVQDIPPAPYPRNITVRASIYGYGTGASPSAAAADVQLRASYTDNNVSAGTLLALRATSGGVGYASPLAGFRTYHCDANRPFRIQVVTSVNMYVSGNNQYSQVEVTATPA